LITALSLFDADSDYISPRLSYADAFSLSLGVFLFRQIFRHMPIRIFFQIADDLHASAFRLRWLFTLPSPGFLFSIAAPLSGLRCFLRQSLRQIFSGLMAALSISPILFLR